MGLDLCKDYYILVFIYFNLASTASQGIEDLCRSLTTDHNTHHSAALTIPFTNLINVTFLLKILIHCPVDRYGEHVNSTNNLSIDSCERKG